jgi:peptidoglycan/LPS O-acetylase OafA/YrhL
MVKWENNCLPPASFWALFTKVFEPEQFAMASIFPDSQILLDITPETVVAPRFKLGYRSELDGLRGISILLVFIHHLSKAALPGGFLGVDIFFVLSGFLITSLLVEEWDRDGSISLKKFYIRRALRLMPAVLVLLLVSATFALLFLDSKAQREIFQGIWLTLSYGSNWFYAFRYTSVNNPLGITWSLAIEEQFYLIWPLILAITLWSRVGRRWILYALALLIVSIALHRKLLWEGGAYLPRLYYSTDTRADGLLIGCLISLLCYWNLLHLQKLFEMLMKLIAVVSSVFFVYMLATATNFDAMLYLYGGFTLVSLAVGAILIVLVQWPPMEILRVLRFAPLVWLGRMAYGLYLWHWPIRLLVYHHQDSEQPLSRVTVAALLSITLTLLSFFCIERPFLRLKKQFG